MKKTSQLILALAATAALGIAACGGEEEKPADVECNNNAECAQRTDGKTQCDLTTNTCVAPTVECNTSDDCSARTDGKTDCDPTNHVCVAPVPTTGCSEPEDCASGICNEGVCATAKYVDCDANAIPVHAVPNGTSMKVEVTFDGTNWATPSACPWMCDTGYGLNDAKDGCAEILVLECTKNEDCRSRECDEASNTCLFTKTAACTPYSDEELSQANAVDQDKTVQVTYNYYEYSDGSSAWVSESKCPLTKCEEDYEFNETNTQCITNANDCTLDGKQCEKRTDGKTYCEIPEGEAVGQCITPECTTNADCVNNENGPICQYNKCADTCTYDSDCADNTAGKTICDSLNGVASTWKCVEPECDPQECSTQESTSYFCNAGHWEACKRGLVCAEAGGEGITGTCQVAQSDACDPGCSADQFCRTDNGVSSCEYKASQKTSPTILIDQVYLGGYGNSSTAIYKNGFIELYNYGNADVDLSSLKLYQLTTNGGLSSDVIVDFEKDVCSEGSCILGAHKYFIIKNEKNTVQGTGIAVTGDYKKSFSVGINGGLALISLTDEQLVDLNWSCNNIKKNAVDLIGIGSALCFETSPAQGIPGTTDNSEGNRGTKSYQRTNHADTGNNYYDFLPETPVLHKN